MPTGLGLLMAGGYLTQNGASVLDCPSRNFPQTVDAHWATAAGGAARTSAETAFRWMNNHGLFDSDQPFWTSGGKAAWADGDGIGESSQAGPFNKSQDGGWNGGHQPMQASRTETGYYGEPIFNLYNNPARGCTQSTSSGIYPGNYCWVLGSYMVRPENTTDLSWNAFRLDDAQGQALASDALWGFFYRSTSTVYYGSGTDSVTVEWDDPDELRPQYYYSNHDAAYNVLFADGSVKSFSDGGLNIMKYFVKTMIGHGAGWGDQRLSPTEISSGIWEIYFDALYAQD